MTARSGKDKKQFYALIALLLIVIGILLFLLLKDDGGAGRKRDPNAQVGQYKGKTQEEIQAELNKIVEEGMFNISVNPTVTMENGRSEADFRIENIAANRHLMSVQVVLDDTGEAIYTSGLIEPGYHIQTAPLDRPLSKGVYDATAVFTAFDPQTEESAGQAAVRIKIIVKK